MAAVTTLVGIVVVEDVVVDAAAATVMVPVVLVTVLQDIVSIHPRPDTVGARIQCRSCQYRDSLGRDAQIRGTEVGSSTLCLKRSNSQIDHITEEVLFGSGAGEGVGYGTRREDTNEDCTAEWKHLGSGEDVVMFSDK